MSCEKRILIDKLNVFEQYQKYNCFIHFEFLYIHQFPNEDL